MKPVPPGAFGQELAAATARATPLASPLPSAPESGGEAPPAPPAPPEPPPDESIPDGSTAEGSATTPGSAAAAVSPLLDRLGISPGLARVLKRAREHVPPGATLQIFSREPGRFRGHFMVSGAAGSAGGASDGPPSLPEIPSDETAGEAGSGSLLPPLLPGDEGIPPPPLPPPPIPADEIVVEDEDESETGGTTQARRARFIDLRTETAIEAAQAGRIITDGAGLPRRDRRG